MTTKKYKVYLTQIKSSETTTQLRLLKILVKMSEKIMLQYEYNGLLGAIETRKSKINLMPLNL